MANESGPGRILITGASGTLGGPLTVQAAAAGWDVLAAYFLRPERVQAGTPVWLDLRDGVATLNAVREMAPDVIVHAAVTERSGPGYGEAIRLAARHIAEAAGETGARLVALSTDLVLDGRAEVYADDAASCPLAGAEYGAAKADTEALVLDRMPNAAVVRTSLIYDFVADNPQVAWMLRRIAQGESLALFTDQIRCPIWAENLAAAVLEVAWTDYAGRLNVVGPEAMSRYDLGCGLLAAMGVDAAQYVVPTSAPETMPRRLVLAISRARELLDTPLLSFDAARDCWEGARA